MDQSFHNFKLIMALLKAELSVNAMLMALSKVGFRSERNIYGLHEQLFVLIGFSREEMEKDELLDFYITKLDCLTQDHLLESTENIHETALSLYAALLYKRSITYT